MSTTPTPRPVAVITGASQGLGLALTDALAEQGWDLVVDARRADRLEAAAARLRRNTEVTALVGDVTDPAHRDDLVAAARSRPGPVRLLVNNASTLGASPLPALDAVSAEVLDRTFAVNVTAPVVLAGALAEDLAGGGVIVNVTSDAAVEAYEGWGAYGSAKAALEHASRVLAVEHPELRVLLVDPGDLRTEMHQDAFPDEDISDRPLPETVVPAFLALIDRRPPSGRYRASELAAPAGVPGLGRRGAAQPA
jgi:NAD(P)-dependent dehydrogenase (short-subunit alcohol dehydrogenase family)